MTKRVRKVGSIRNELISKARESMLSAVQIFNNPNILFKSESFIVLSVIAWTYMLHAYYRGEGVEYRYYTLSGKRRIFNRTKDGVYKYWELEKCLDFKDCPIDKSTKNNLKFLIGLRHEIEHQMTTRIDDYLSARFQACCLNFNNYIKDFFGTEMGIDKHLSFSLQFSSISEPEVKTLNQHSDLPKNIASYISNFDDSITEEEYNDQRYAYRVLFVPKMVNSKGQADRVIEFLPANSAIVEELNKEYILIKDREKPKYRAGDVVRKMQEKGFSKFKMNKHTQLWQSVDARNPGKGYGAWVANEKWYWYQSWITYVENYCDKHREEFS